MKRDPVHALEPPTERLERWFAANGWRAFPFQHEVWNAYLNGESGLVQGGDVLYTLESGGKKQIGNR